MSRPRARVQCAKCPWKAGVNPRDIPGEYSEAKHRALASAIAKAGDALMAPLRIMACHETSGGREQACVGWVANQIGAGNNIALRFRAARDPSIANVRTVGPQRATFEETLPT